MRRQLVKLGLGYRRHDRQADGDDVDLGALVDFAVSRATEAPGDDRVYEARLRTGRDLGVFVLLDASGSTGEQRTGGSTVWDEQRLLAAELVEALEGLGERVAAYAFNSRGRSHVRFLRIKEFDGRFDSSARDRLARLEPSGFTRLGAAIRHATHRLRVKAGTSNLLVVLVSDGFAYDDEYEGRYGEQDVRHALEEATEAGIGCVCVSVGSSTPDTALERLWGNVTHVRLRDSTLLEKHVGASFRAALRSVAKQQR